MSTSPKPSRQTPALTAITAEERRQLDERVRDKHQKLRNRYPEIYGKAVTGQPEATYTNAAMQHGIDTEPEARAAYAFMTDADVTEVGLVRHPKIASTHASPDGFRCDTQLLSRTA